MVLSLIVVATSAGTALADVIGQYRDRGPGENALHAVLLRQQAFPMMTPVWFSDPVTSTRRQIGPPQRWRREWGPLEHPEVARRRE